MISQGVTIPTEGGLLLASQKNPWAEASKWAERLQINQSRVQVVLGLGAGVHVLELARKTAQKIFVIDPRAQLVSDFMSLLELEVEASSLKDRIVIGDAAKIFSELASTTYQVHSFQPAWGPRVAEFHTYRDFLNCRDLESAKTVAKVISEKTRQLVTFKDLEPQGQADLIIRELFK